MARHAGSFEIGALVAGWAAHRRKLETVRAALDWRLMQAGMFACDGMHVQYPAYLSERFPTEVRATAVAFCFHPGGAIWGGLISPLLILYATTPSSACRVRFSSPRWWA